MNVRLTELAGIAELPSSRRALKEWCSRSGIDVVTSPTATGPALHVRFADLPSAVGRAWLERQIAEAGLEPGEHDDAAHDAFRALPAWKRAAAATRAAILRFWTIRQRHGVRWADIAREGCETFGDDFPSRSVLYQWRDKVDGVDPINWVTALAPGDRGRPAVAPMDETAWRFFMTRIRDANHPWPLKSAWCETRDFAAARGLAWPSEPTVRRRWDALPEPQRLEAIYDKETAAEMLAIPHLREKPAEALTWVSLDGRMLDAWVDWGDGKARRPIMLILVDVSSGKTLDFELCKTENAAATLRLIRRTCRTYGIFDRLYTDNGSAFASHIVAGGEAKKWRRRSADGVQPPGICHHLGIELKFALPKNAQAKLAERKFADFSRSIDDRPEFRGAHAGHAPGAAPNRAVTPVPVARLEAVLRREIERNNRERGRRGQGMNGRSYDEVFEATVAGRIKRTMTERQHYLAGLVYEPRSIDRHGRIAFAEGAVYGTPATQMALRPWHGRGPVLVGRDPDDYGLPVVVYDPDGNLIADDVQRVVPGAYDSREGAAEAARNRKAARRAIAQAAAANNYFSDTEMDAALSDLEAECAKEAAASATPERTTAPTVVKPRFNGRGVPKATTPDRTTALTDEMRRNFDRAVGFAPRRERGA
ncbi:MAG: transposase domain-containing protein [Erythrobacter sp.]|jgi:putative transposase|nr:transposase domain-containing protein [Erythrobacter sp.]